MTRRVRTWLTYIAVAGLAVAFYLSKTRPAPRLEIGSQAPAHRWTDISGRTVALSHYRGKVVLLDFWATWCPSCQEELPALQKLYSDLHPRGLELLASSVDEDGRKVLVPYLASHAIPWKVLLSDSEDVSLYDVDGLPTKFLIDRSGNIFRKYVGPVPLEDLESDVRAALAR